MNYYYSVVLLLCSISVLYYDPVDAVHPEDRMYLESDEISDKFAARILDPNDNKLAFQVVSEPISDDATLVTLSNAEPTTCVERLQLRAIIRLLISQAHNPKSPFGRSVLRFTAHLCDSWDNGPIGKYIDDKAEIDQYFKTHCAELRKDLLSGGPGEQDLLSAGPDKPHLCCYKDAFRGPDKEDLLSGGPDKSQTLWDAIKMAEKGLERDRSSALLFVAYKLMLDRSTTQIGSWGEISTPSYSKCDEISTPFYVDISLWLELMLRPGFERADLLRKAAKEDIVCGYVLRYGPWFEDVASLAKQSMYKPLHLNKIAIDVLGQNPHSSWYYHSLYGQQVAVLIAAMIYTSAKQVIDVASSTIPDPVAFGACIDSLVSSCVVDEEIELEQIEEAMTWKDELSDDMWKLKSKKKDREEKMKLKMTTLKNELTEKAECAALHRGEAGLASLPVPEAHDWNED